MPSRKQRILTLNRTICANLIMFLFAFGITSCTTVTTPPDAPTSTITWQDRQTQLNRIQAWQISGKIAVHTSNDAGSATVNWAQNHGHYTVALFGPLGTNGLKLSGQPGNVTLEMANGKRISASNPEELLAKEWGFNLPVSHLNYWIRGLPAPGTASTQFDNYHRLTQVNQEGWTVQFLSYTTINKLDLPTKLEITSSSLTSKIIIYDWKIG